MVYPYLYGMGIRTNTSVLSGKELYCVLRGVYSNVMSMKDAVPKAISEQQRKGGLARARKYSHAQLRRQSRRAWQTRLENARKAVNKPQNPGMGM